MYGLTLVTAPTEEPITLAEAKLQLRIVDDSPSTNPEDTLITAMIVAARRACERHKEEGFVTQTWDLFLDKFPAYERTVQPDRCRWIEIPKGPLQYVESLTYKDSSGTLQVVSFIDPSGTVLYETDEYIVDRARKRLCLKNGISWPETAYDGTTWPQVLNEPNAIALRFVCGYGPAADVPGDIKAAIKITLSWLYENRGDVDPKKVPGAVEMLLGPKTVLA